jgi:ribosomal protein S3AE
VLGARERESTPAALLRNSNISVSLVDVEGSVILKMAKTTIQVSANTKSELSKIKGELLAKDGVNRTFDDIVQELIFYWITGEKRKGFFPLTAS